MADPGAEATDAIIEEIERRIEVEYAQAQREIQEKLDAYNSAFETKDNTWQKWVESGKKTQEEYDQWRVGQIAVGKRWEEMRDSISQDLLNANKIAQSIAKGYMPEVYALNHDYGTFQVEQGSLVDTSYSLYSRETAERLFRDDPQMLPAPGKKVSKDIAEGRALRWNNRHIQSVMMQALLQGNSIPDIATRLSNAVCDTNRKAATRNARTMVTAAQNGGRIDAYKRAQSLGIKTKKQWLATLDSRTRHEHRMLDGAVAEVDKPFMVDGEKIMFPGDPQAAPQLVYNCRCTLLSVIDNKAMDVSDLSQRRSEKLGDMTYDEWREEKATSNPILSQEEKSEGIRGAYIREYRGYGGPVESGLNKSLDIDAKNASEPTRSTPVYAEGRDIYDGWTWDSDKWEFAIEQAIHDQGFDGLPQVVGKEEFDEMVRQSGMVSQRVYTAPDKETLDMYRDALLHGKWYVDCSSGGHTEGQGMYVAADYTGTLSDGIKEEMDKYVALGENRYKNETGLRIFDGLTVNDIKTDKNISEEDFDIIKRYARPYMDEFEDGEDSGLNIIDERRVRNEYGSEYRSLLDTARAKKEEYLSEHPMQYKIETMTLAPDANVIRKDDLDSMMRKDGLTGDKTNPELDDGELGYMDSGVYAALHGYDAINAEGYGASGSYTVVLNRTKTYILDEGEDE